MSAHRWSGWPGAWCLDCGAPDMNEVCLAEHAVLTVDIDRVTGDQLPVCLAHENAPCPEPGSRRCDPYKGQP